VVKAGAAQWLSILTVTVVPLLFPLNTLAFRGKLPLILAQAELDAPPGSSSDDVSVPPAKNPKLDRHTRIELLFVLVMLVAVGLGLIAFTWLTARLTRRYMKPGEKLPARRPDAVFTDDWAAKPLTDQERAKLDSDQW
jgi:hypothetical protein